MAKSLNGNGYKREYQVTYDHNYEGSTNERRVASYEFDGWSKLANGEKEYEDREEVENLSITNGDTVNLYARWKETSVSYTPSRVGYTFGGWYSEAECENQVTTAEDTSYVPTEKVTLYAKWTVNNYEYRVNYLEKDNDSDNANNKVLHTAKVDRSKVYGTEVIAENEYIEIFGYKYDSSNDITITEIEENNIINIYYVVDEEQTKELSYTVEYYKDGEQVTEDTQIERETVQVLHDNFIEVNREKINIEDKYYGYRLEKIEPGAIPEKIETGSTIKVYYIVDDENTKTLSYQIEYYKGNEKFETKTGTKTVQVLEESKLEVEDRENVAKNNRYFGYKLNSIEIVENGQVKDRFSDIEDLENKIPEVVNNKTVIKVYYEIDDKQTKEIKYTVEYYKEGAITEEDTQREEKIVQVLEPDILEVNKEKINIVDKYFGYKLQKIELVEIEDSEVVKNIGTQLPNEVKHNTTIRVYYMIDEEQTKELSYTVEYYKDGEKQEKDTEVEKLTVQVLHDDTMPVNKEKINIVDKYIAYELDIEATGEIATEIATGEVIRVYYVHNELKTGYKIEYYYNNVLDTSKTELVETGKDEIVTKESITDKIEANKVDGYKVFTVLNAPLVANEDVFNINKNVIKVHYVTEVRPDPENPDIPVATKTGYKVEFYYDNKIDNSKTEVIEVALGERISKETISNKIEANRVEGYKVATVLNAPL